MFEDLSNNSYYTEAMVKNVLKGTFMEGNDNVDGIPYSTLFMEAAKSYNVSPVYLASLSRQEVGTKMGLVTSGEQFEYKGITYVGFYNFYNIGARSSEENPAKAGLVYAAAGAVPNSDGVYVGNIGSDDPSIPVTDPDTGGGSSTLPVVTPVASHLSNMGLNRKGSYLTNVTMGATVATLKSKTNGEELTLLIERNNEEIEIKLKPTEKYTKSTGIYVSQAQTGDKATQIIQIEKGSNAEKDGLQANDVIKTINGIDVTGDVQKLVNEIQNTTSDKAKIEVERNNEIIELELTIDSIPTYYLGINFRMAENNFTNNIYYAFYRTGDFLASIAENIKMLFTGNVGLDQMTGPIGISNMVSQTTGFADFMYLLALVSISLGITNLLPIPALDGGKLLILLIEAIRRKPMKEELEIGIQLVGFFILISLSIIISYKDILRIF